MLLSRSLFSLLLLALPLSAQDERWACEADLQFTGLHPADHVGWEVASGGDWNSDGKQDFLLSTGFEQDSGIGEVYLFKGQGCPPTACDTAPPVELTRYAIVFTGLQVHAAGIVGNPLKGSAACALVGDLNNGGRDDIAIGEPFWSKDASHEQVGRVFIFYGENHVSTPVLTELVPEDDADLIIEGTVPYGWFGYSLDGLNVTTSDSNGDLLVGAPANFDSTAGASLGGQAFVITGASIAAASGSVTVTSLNEVVYPDSSASEAGDRFGNSVARVGNLNSDAKDEFVVGAPYVFVNGGFIDPPPTVAGKHGYAKVFGYPSTTAIYTFTGAVPLDGDLKGFGMSVAGAPSVNNNVNDDIVVGAPYYKPFDTSMNKAIVIGAVYVYDGRQGNQLYGGPVTPKDGSGQPDEAYEGAMLGYDVDGVADFDGDGKGDFMAGAPLYKEPGASTPCGTIGANGDLVGRVLVYDGTDGTTILARYRGESLGGKPRLGFSVAAGDIDGDGATDTLAGAMALSLFSPPVEEGRSYVFFNEPCCP